MRCVLGPPVCIGPLVAATDVCLGEVILYLFIVVALMGICIWLES